MHEHQDSKRLTKESLLFYEEVMNLEERIIQSVELAASLLERARVLETKKERKEREQLASLVQEANGKEWLVKLTDCLFRSSSWKKTAGVIKKLVPIPSFLSSLQHIVLKYFNFLFVPLMRMGVRHESKGVILEGEKRAILRHIKKRNREGIEVNLNHLGEAILGEKEVKKRFDQYIEDLKNEEITYISIKISTLYSQIQLIDPEGTINILADRLRELYRGAKGKFVYLDMEEYRDLHLTVKLFKKVLSEPEFWKQSAGIVLQAYLPDSYLIQQELTVWALQRVSGGGSPIKIRLVKGANLAMEQLEAHLRGWPQAPYTNKLDVDASYKRMLHYGMQKEHAEVVHLGVGSHNLFDIAYALILRKENGVANEVNFEMLEGMAGSMARVVLEESGSLLLYSPVVKKKDFSFAIGYLVRRLDENTGLDNFLRHYFDITTTSSEWKKQVSGFATACRTASSLSFRPRRTQNRLLDVEEKEEGPFENEPDTDWSLPQNQLFAKKILEEKRKWENIPLVIQGKEVWTDELAKVLDPSCPGTILCEHALGLEKHVDLLLKETEFSSKGDLKKVAHFFRQERGLLIQAMVANGGKTVQEADVEVSEAIDFIEYYRSLTIPNGIPNGVVVIASPWNFPCAIPVSGIVAALFTGNRVIFKPAPQTVLVGYLLANLFWRGGFSKEQLQFFPCLDAPVGTKLIQDPRVKKVVLTGGTDTARLFLKWRPDLDLAAETGGKNSIIVTALADRDLAVKDVIQSAFGNAGQKCSACSLVILEREVYDDPLFKEQLLDAARSLKVGSSWDPSTKINPLISLPSPHLMKGLTTLEKGEEWLLQPLKDPSNSQLWSPGIKWGVCPGSFMHQTELFGPVIGVMKAEDLTEAIVFANQTPYGLTAGLHSLDREEQNQWIESIMAGNLYINRGITGAIVRRQPFGGCKASCFGVGHKPGGPNYLEGFIMPMDSSLKDDYEEAWKQLSKPQDPSAIPGQQNLFYYVPRPIFFYLQETDKEEDREKVKKACSITGSPLHIVDGKVDLLVQALQNASTKIVRLVSPPSPSFLEAIRETGATLITHPPLLEGKRELLNYIREVSLSIDTHRYGNIFIFN